MRWLWVLLLAVFLSGCVEDIVVILADDLRPETVAAMPTVQAELVGHGVTFTSFIAPTPVCEPARATLLTGLLPSHHGVQWVVPPNGGAPAFVGPDVQTLATTLKSHGYVTGLFGKYLNSYDAQGPPNVPSWYIPPGWDRWRALRVPRYFDYDLVQENGTTVHHGSASADYSTDVIRDEAVAWLNSVPKTQGACAWIAPFGPHMGAGWVPQPAPRHVGMFAGLAPWRPPSFNEADLSDKPAWLQGFPLLDAVDIDYLDTFRKAQYEAAQAVDDLVAAIIATQKARKRYGQTVIVFLSDNGMGWGEHRRLVVKGTAFEHDIVVPLVVRAAGLTPRVESALLSQVDLMPSILGGLGYVPPAGLDGQDYSALVQATGAGRASAALEGYLGSAAGPYTGTRTPTETTVLYGTGETEHYGLGTDPWELVSQP